MALRDTPIDGLWVSEWRTHSGERGVFRQTYQLAEFLEAVGLELAWRKGNDARAAPAVLRGFHTQPWDKCVYVARGTATAAIADIHPYSPNLGQLATFHLGDLPGERLWLLVSEGLPNAVCACGDVAVEYLHDVTEEHPRWTSGPSPGTTRTSPSSGRSPTHWSPTRTAPTRPCGSVSPITPGSPNLEQGARG